MWGIEHLKAKTTFRCRHFLLNAEHWERHLECIPSCTSSHISKLSHISRQEKTNPNLIRCLATAQRRQNLLAKHSPALPLQAPELLEVVLVPGTMRMALCMDEKLLILMGSAIQVFADLPDIPNSFWLWLRQIKPALPLCSSPNSRKRSTSVASFVAVGREAGCRPRRLRSQVLGDTSQQWATLWYNSLGQTSVSRSQFLAYPTVPEIEVH